MLRSGLGVGLANPNPKPNPNLTLTLALTLNSSFIDGLCGLEPIAHSAARHTHIAAPPRLPRAGAGAAVPGIAPAAVAR